MKTFFRGALCALLLTVCTVLASCGAAQPTTSSFEAMDTLMTLKVYSGGSDIGDKLQSRIETLDASLDATDENSEIYRLNTKKTSSLSEETADLLTESLTLCEQLDGAFDITVYPAVQAWGFTAGDCRVPDEDELKTLAENISYNNVRFNGQSFSDQDGAQAAILNLGGTICLYGQKPDGSRFTVGVADPDNPAAYFGTLACDQGTVATSGGYERYFEQDGRRYIHILDPATAKPVDNGTLSVTIVSDNGTFADAASTALFVMGLDKAIEYYQNNSGFDFIILTNDNNLYITEGIYDDFTLCDGYDFTLHKISK